MNMTSAILELPGASVMGSSSTPARAATVFIIAGNVRTRHSLEGLLSGGGYDVESCASAEEFLSLSRPGGPCCLLLVMLTGVNGLALQQQFGVRAELPVIVITVHPDVRVAVQAIKSGAIDVLANPVNPRALLSAVGSALEQSRAALCRNIKSVALRARYESLTPREREVMALVVSGLLNKQVAFELAISEITVKAHRGQVMRKMKADSLPHLAAMAACLQVARPWGALDALE